MPSDDAGRVTMTAVPCPSCGVKTWFGPPKVFVLHQPCLNCDALLRYDGTKVEIIQRQPVHLDPMGVPRMRPVLEIIERLTRVAAAAGMSPVPTTLRSEGRCHEAPPEMPKLAVPKSGCWGHLGTEVKDGSACVQHVDVLDPWTHPVGATARLVIKDGKRTWEVRIPSTATLPMTEWQSMPETVEVDRAKMAETMQAWEDGKSFLRPFKVNEQPPVDYPQLGHAFSQPVLSELTPEVTAERRVPLAEQPMTEPGRATLNVDGFRYSQREFVMNQVKMVREKMEEVGRRIAEKMEEVGRRIAEKMEQLVLGVGNTPAYSQGEPTTFDLHTLPLPIVRHPDQPNMTRPLLNPPPDDDDCPPPIEVRAE